LTVDDWFEDLAVQMKL